LEKIIANLNQGKVSPCYLLYGDEEYLIAESVDRIIDKLVPETDRDFSLFFLDGEDAETEDLLKLIETTSLLGNRKVVVVKNSALFSSRHNTADIIQKIISNIDDYPDKAAKYFHVFLKISGMSLEDLQNNGWKKISDEQWREILEGENGAQDLEKWLPRILEICTNAAFKTRAPEGGEDDAERIMMLAAATGNCVIFTAPMVDKRKKLFKMIAESGAAVYCGKSASAAAQKDNLIKEAQHLLQKYGKKMSPAAWTELGKKTGWDLRRSLAELEKLIFFTGEREIIEQNDVLELVGKTKEDSVFDLTSALGQKNIAAALSALKALLEQGMHPLMILTMLARELRLLIQAGILLDKKILPPCKTNAEYGWFQKNVYPLIADRKEKSNITADLIFSQHPFVIYNAWKNCGNFSLSKLTDLLHDLLEIDLALKSSGADPRILLEKFLVCACAAYDGKKTLNQ